MPEKSFKGVIVSASKVSLAFGGKTILDETGFVVNGGEKVALVGPNGTGKTTIIRMILGEEEPDLGKITVIKKATIGYMPQALSDVKISHVGSMLDFMLSGKFLDEVVRKTQAIYEVFKETDGQVENSVLLELGELQERYEREGGYRAESEIKTILAGLGLPTEDLGERLITSLSGGQKTRLFLSRVLFSEPDFLLLDEPTNHLDEKTIDWLRGYLKGFRGAAMIVSHHQKFLDETCSNTLYLNPLTCKIETYKGNYSFFLDQVKRRKEKEGKIMARRLREKERMWTFVNRWRSHKNKRGAVRSRLRKLEKIGAVEKPRRGKEIRVSFPVKERSGDPVLIVEGITKSYEDSQLFPDLSFSIRRGEKIAIMGPNGAGKTTLLKMVIGWEQPNSGGEVRLDNKTSIGFCSQGHEELDFQLTPIEQLRGNYPGASYQRMRAVLGHFLLSQQAMTPISKLSQGEKSRLVLAKVVMSGANFLILDEPTNHLDAQSRKQLIEALLTYDGTIMVVSHDEELLMGLDIDRVLILPEGKWVYGSKIVVDGYKD